MALGSDQQWLYNEQVEQLYKRAPIGILATSLNSLILVFVLWNHVPHSWLGIWLGALVVVTVARHIFLHRHLQAAEKNQDMSLWNRWFVVGIGLSGVVWGAAGIALFPDSTGHQVFLVFVLGGMVAGATATFSVVLSAYLAFSLPVMLPVTVRFFWIGDEISIAMGVMLTLFSVLMLATAKRVNRSAFRIYELNDSIALAMKQVEQSNKELKLEIDERTKAQKLLQDHRDNLSGMVEERTAELTSANRQLQIEVEERRKAQGSLKQNEAKYRLLVENINDCIFATDNELRLTYISPAIQSMTGQSPEGLVGTSLFELFLPEDLQRAQTLVDNGGMGGPDLYEYPLAAQHGEQRWVRLSLQAIAGGGDSSGYQGVLIDITMRKQAEQERELLEQQLRHAGKMEAVGTLAGGIAHDFNNILQTIMGFAEVLRAEMLPGEDGAEEMSDIVEAARKGSILTQQLLTFSRKVDSFLTPVSLNSEIEKTYKLLRRTIPKMIDIQLSLAPDLCPVQADASQLEQVLVNLAVNAKDAMPDGGVVHIETKNTELHEGATEADAATPYVLLTFEDNGRGMDADTLEHIFDPFYTTKGLAQGTGLGLSMVYGIVKNHHGHIMCTSKPKKGALFEIYLPAVDAAIAEQFVEDETEAPVGGSETLLVVDDEDKVREVCQSTLQRFGYTVLTARDGRQALDIYSQRSETIDLVILDLIMPEMSGQRCLRGLLDIAPGVKVIVVSGFSDSGPIEESLSAGAMSFLSKPYRSKKLLATIREVLDNSS